MNEKEKDCVEFCNRTSAIPGAISGAVIAIGVPAVTLVLGKSLGPSVQLVVILVGVAIGGLIALTSTFFSLVIPSKVNGWDNCGCETRKSDQTVQGNNVTQTL